MIEEPISAEVRIPQVGDIVQYVLAKHDGCKDHCAGEHRPAIVVRKWGNEYQSAIQLQVLVDGGNDFPYPHLSALTGMFWATSVAHDAEHQPHTWHWPEHHS